MGAVQILVKGGTNVIELRKLRNTLAARGTPEEFPTGATVTLTLKETVSGAIVLGVNAMAMAYVAGTTGKRTAYRAILSNTIVLDTAKAYTAAILASMPGGVRPFNIKCRVIEG